MELCATLVLCIKTQRNIYKMEEHNNNVVKEGLKYLFSSKVFVHLVIFVVLGIITVIAGNIIVQEGSLTTTDNLTVGGELIGSRGIFCFGDWDYKTAGDYAYFEGVKTTNLSAPVMWRSGKVVGYSASVNIVNATSGNLGIKLRKFYANASNTDLAEFKFYSGLGTGWMSNYTTFSRSSGGSFQAGDKLTIKEAETGNMGWDDLIVCAEVQFDS